MGIHPSKVQGNWEQVNTTQSKKKNKSKQSMKNKEKENSMQLGLEATKWQSTITKKT